MQVAEVEMERTADDSDRASLLEAQFTEMHLERTRALCAPEAHPDFDGVHCVGCWDEIPSGRLEMVRVRCTKCQTELEQRSKQFRPN